MNKRTKEEIHSEVSKMTIADIKQDVRLGNAQACFRRKPYGNSIFTTFIQEIPYEEIIETERERMRQQGIGFSETTQGGLRDAYVINNM